MKHWPENIPKQLTFRNGEKPLHEYLSDHAKTIPEKTAYIFYGKEITWKDLNQYSDRLANYFISRKIIKGDRIALFLQNSPQYIIAHYAIQKIGAVVVPISPMNKEAELEYMINEIGIKAIVSGDELYPLLENVKENTPTLAFAVTTNYADFLPEQPVLPIPDELKLKKKVYQQVDDLFTIFKEYDDNVKSQTFDIWEDVSLMVFTSGTTGRPKAAMLTYGNALFKTAASFHANELNTVDCSLAAAPLSHIAGMVMGVNLPVYSGGTSVLLTRFDPLASIDAIETYKCQTWYSVAPMNAAILNTPGVEKRDLTSLRTNMATSFGMNVTEKMATQWGEITDGCKLYEAAYGLSETHTCDTFMPADNIHFGTCGIPTYDTDVRIVDLDSGNELPPGKEGEIVIKNPGVFKGYWNRPDATEATLQNGWVFTGDIGFISNEGYLNFVGRVKEMIKSSGYSIFPEDVEALLMNCDAVEQVAVIGVTEEKRGESVKAFIVLKDRYKGKVLKEDIINWAKANMAAYKYPRTVEFREQLPTTSSGKVLRRLLKE
nr:AMP-binding protein [Tuberibacillus sp. Marseille-P3662]